MKPLRRYFYYAILIAGALWMLFPFIWMVSTSFKTNNGILVMPPQLIPNPFTTRNYERIAEIYPIWRFAFNSFFVAVTATAGNLLTSSMAAYAFARLQWKGREALFLVYLATLMIPQQVTLAPLFILMRWLGWANTYQALILPGFVLGFGTFLLRQYFFTIPRALEEAAFVDGASHWTVYSKIFIPLSRPALGTLAVFSFMSSWNSFLWPLIITSNPKLMTLPVGLATLQGRYTTEWNMVMAGAVLNVLPMIVIYLLAQREFVKGVTLSGIKG